MSRIIGIDLGTTHTVVAYSPIDPKRKGAPIHYVEEPNQASEREFVTNVHLSHEVRPGAFTMRIERASGGAIAVPSRHFVAAGRFEHRDGEYVGYDLKATRMYRPDIDFTPVEEEWLARVEALERR